MNEDRVPAKLMQQAYTDSKYDLETASSLSGFKSTTDFKRAIGLMPYNSRGNQKTITHVSYERACQIVQGLNLWPIDYGI